MKVEVIVRRLIRAADLSPHPEVGRLIVEAARFRQFCDLSTVIHSFDRHTPVKNYESALYDSRSVTASLYRQSRAFGENRRVKARETKPLSPGSIVGTCSRPQGKVHEPATPSDCRVRAKVNAGQAGRGAKVKVSRNRSRSNAKDKPLARPSRRRIRRLNPQGE